MVILVFLPKEPAATGLSWEDGGGAMLTQWGQTQGSWGPGSPWATGPAAANAGRTSGEAHTWWNSFSWLQPGVLKHEVISI